MAGSNGMMRTVFGQRFVDKRTLAGMLIIAVINALGCSQNKLQVLIIDGQNNHNWQLTTAVVKASLEDTGRFTVDVVTTPPMDSPADAWEAFGPDFRSYDVVLSNYNDYQPRKKGDRWGKGVESALERYVSGGGGLVIVHAANNAFYQWPAWNEMIGLGWRHKTFGDRIYLEDDGKIVRIPKGEGQHASHGAVHEYKITVRDPGHAIMKGIPAEWLHAKDELYHSQRGPAVNMRVLASAYSSLDSRGTGKHEPIMWVVSYGKGRVFTTLLGHVMEEDSTAVRCVGFQTTLCRGTEWAATGRVTVPVPSNFPTAKQVRTVE